MIVDRDDIEIFVDDSALNNGKWDACNVRWEEEDCTYPPSMEKVSEIAEAAIFGYIESMIRSSPTLHRYFYKGNREDFEIKEIE